MKHIWKIFLLLAAIGTVSCQKDEPAASGTFRVDFAGMAQSRASVFVPVNRTVRVVVYRSHQGATEPDLTRERVAENTYYFSSGTNATLTACLVNDQGVKQTGTAPVMTLPFFSKNNPGYFDIYVYSPAVALNPDGKSVTVTNNMDFMAACKIGYQIPALTNIASTTITLPDMKRYCSAISLNDLYTENNVYMAMAAKAYNAATGRYRGIAIDNLCANGTYVLGVDSIAVNRTSGNVTPTVYLLNNLTDLPANVVPVVNNPAPGGTIDLTRLGTCKTSGSAPNIKTDYESCDLYVLPWAAANPVAKNKFSLRIDLRLFSPAVPSNVNNNPIVTLVTTAIDGNALKKGQRTAYSIKVAYDGVSTSGIVFPSVPADSSTPIIDWEPDGQSTNNI